MIERKSNSIFLRVVIISVISVVVLLIIFNQIHKLNSFIKTLEDQLDALIKINKIQEEQINKLNTEIINIKYKIEVLENKVNSRNK